MVSVLFYLTLVQLTFFVTDAQVSVAAKPIPLVIWHGMGDSCCNPLSMGSIKKMVEDQIPGIYVVSLEIGDGIIEDTLNGFLMPIAKQITMACNIVKADPILMKNGFNSMGFSQGGQFLRALLQQCDGIKMHNLISFGGQHQGVAGFPKCPVTLKYCNELRHLLNKEAYRNIIEKNLVQAEYWHDALDENNYKENNIFLPDLNNEITVNQLYKDRLMSLKKFVMVRFNNDTMVQPKSSEWFGFYSPGQDIEEIPLQKTELYKSDQLGLQSMDKNGQLDFLSTDGDHLEIRTSWFTANIIPYLNNAKIGENKSFEDFQIIAMTESLV